MRLFFLQFPKTPYFCFAVAGRGLTERNGAIRQLPPCCGCFHTQGKGVHPTPSFYFTEKRGVNMLIPMLSIHPSRITAYYYSLEHKRGDVKPLLTGSQVRERQNGLLSNQARKRLYQAITALCAITPWHTVYSKKDGKSYRHKLSFITLTLPAHHGMSDKDVNQKILKKFLDNWNKRSPKLLYVWKAEVTDRGTLHYHITCNTYIHYAELRKRWNTQLYKAGVIPKNDIESNNSTDVHSVNKMRNIAAYLTSYITKKDLYTKVLKRWLNRYKQQLSNQTNTHVQLPRNYYKHIKRKPQCQLWSCSKPLLNTKMSDCYQGSEIERELNNNATWCGRMVTTDYFSTCYIKANEWQQSNHIKKAWNQFMTERIRNDKGNRKVYKSF